MEYEYDLQEIKESLTLSQIKDIVAELGGEPRDQGNAIISKTICHCGQHHKLWYWDNTHLFKCFTDCGETFDIFELVRKVKSVEIGTEYQLPQAVEFVASYFGFSKNKISEDSKVDIEDYLTSIKNYDRINNIDIKTQIVELKEYEDGKNILNNLPQVRFPFWEEEGISNDVIKYANIRYNPKDHRIVIPYYDDNDRLIGIRERALLEEDILKYGKYRPARLDNKMFNHPLGFGLFQLNNAKENLNNFRTAIIFEGEKSVLKYMSYFGIKNNISVACTGSNITSYQIDLLKKYNVKNIIIAFDREGENDDKEKYVKKFYIIQKKYGQYFNISFLYDKNGEILPYKTSPIDVSKEVFLQLYNERINLYD